MPIRIQCQCGKALNVPDSLAGKAVKCPACAAVSRVPASGAASGAATRPAAAGRPPSAAAGTGPGSTATRGPGASGGPAAKAKNDSMDDLFDEAGFSAHVAAICPACRAEMAAGAVLCTKCGYHVQQGVRLDAHKTAGVDIDHGTLALEKAERDMASATKMQKDLITGGGMPWWMLALVLFVLISGLTIAVLAVNASRRVDESIDFDPMQLFLVLAGSAFYLIAQVAFLLIVIHAFKQSVLKGVLTLLIPLYALYHVARNFAETWKLLAASILMGGIAGALFMAAASR